MTELQRTLIAVLLAVIAAGAGYLGLEITAFCFTMGTVLVFFKLDQFI